MKYLINSMIIMFLITHGMLMAQENVPIQSINPLEIKRTYTKDLFGYSPEEIDTAKKFLQETLYPERNGLIAKIKLLADTLKEPLKEGYDQITIAELKQAKEQLKECSEEIYKQEIIAGQRSSALVRGVKYGIATAALTGMVVLGASYYWAPEIHHEKFLAGDEGGWVSYLRNRLIGEPYKIHQPNELKFWDYSAKEWKPVVGNEELAKHAPLKEPGMFNWGYRDKDDEIEGMIAPVRGEFVFWDEKIGAYREATHAEKREFLFDQLFVWPKYRAQGLIK